MCLSYYGMYLRGVDNEVLLSLRIIKVEFIYIGRICEFYLVFFC